MLSIQDIETRKKELEVSGIEKSKKTWHRVHKSSEHLNNLFGGTGIDGSKRLIKTDKDKRHSPYDPSRDG